MDNTNNKTAVDNQATSVGASSPVGLSQKEHGPIPVASELITPSESEPMLDREVRDAGVEQVSDRFPLTAEHEKVGIKHAGESTPVPTQPSGMVKLPMSEEEVLKTIKTTSKSDSKHWLAVLIEKIYKQLKFIYIK